MSSTDPVDSSPQAATASTSPAADAGAPAAPSRSAELRARISRELTLGPDLEAFLIDYFPEIQRELSSGMSRTERLNLLLLRADLDAVEHALAARRPEGRQSDRAPTSAGAPSHEPQDRLLTGIVPLGLAEQIRSFLSYYLGSVDNPVPFGGRDEAFAMLDTWLAEPQPSCFLLTAPAGRGKSALLARWSARLAARTDLDVIFYPISVRFGTQQSSAILGALCGRLAHLHREDAVRSQEQASYAELRERLHLLLRRPAPSGRQVVVVLDGLDEAASLALDAKLFPVPAAGVRLVLSVREGTGGRRPQELTYDLGWERGRALMFPLQSLSRLEDIASILESTGLPLAQLASGPRSLLLQRLLELGEGEPLLIRYILEELLESRVPLAELPSHLQTFEPGFDDLLERWWRRQKQTVDAGALREYQSVLDVLSVACGALQRGDLLAVLPESLSSSRRIDEALAALGRFIVEDSARSGLVLSHPKLRDYFWGRLSKKEQRALDARFVAYGQEVVAELERGALAPDAVPRYLLHHLSMHLARSDQDLARHMALISRAWHDAWAAADGEVGFLSDVRRALGIAGARNRSAVKAGQPPPHLLDELRCALTVSTVRGRAANVSAELLRALLASRRWSPTQALAHIRQAAPPAASLSDSRQVIAALTVLAPHLSGALLREAAAFAVPFVHRPRADTDVLAALVPRFVAADPDYLSALLASLPSWARTRLQLQAAEHAPSAALRARFLDEAEQSCGELSEFPSLQASSYRQLAAADPPRRQGLLPAALEAARRIPRLDARLDEQVWARTSWPDSPELLAETLETIRRLRGSGLTENELSHALFRAAELPEELAAELLRALEREPEAPEALLRMYTGGNVPDPFRERMLQVARAWPETSRQRLVRLVLEELSPHREIYLLDRVLALALQLGSEADRAEALARVGSMRKEPTRAYGRALLAGLLPAAERLAALRHALRQLEGEDLQRECARSILPHLTESEEVIAGLIFLSEAHPALRRDLAASLAEQPAAGEEARSALRQLVDRAQAELSEAPPAWHQALDEALALLATDPARASRELALALEQAGRGDEPGRIERVLLHRLQGATERGAGDAEKRALWHHLRRYYEQHSLYSLVRGLQALQALLPPDLRREPVEVALARARSERHIHVLLELRSHLRSEERDGLLEEVLALARRLGDDLAQLQFCAALAETVESQQRILRAVPGLSATPLQRLYLLSQTLRPRLATQLLPELVAAARTELARIAADSPQRLGALITVAELMAPVDAALHQSLVAQAWDLLTQLQHRHRLSLNVEAEGDEPPRARQRHDVEVASLHDSGPRLAPFLKPEQVRELLAGLPQRPMYRWHRLQLAGSLPPAEQEAEWRAQRDRLAKLGAGSVQSLEALALLAAYAPPAERRQSLAAALAALDRPQCDGDVHEIRLPCLLRVASSLDPSHQDRLFDWLSAASESVGAVSRFPMLLAELPGGLRAPLAARLFAYSAELPADRQERLRAHLVAAVTEPEQQELALQAAVCRPEQSVLTALQAAGPQLPDDKLQRLVQGLCEVLERSPAGNELTQAATALLVEQQRRALPWLPSAYRVLHQTLNERHRRRADLLQALTVQAPLLSALLKAAGRSCDEAVAVVRELCCVWP